MNPAIIRKYFIAEAVCSICSEWDKIQMWEEDGVPHRECVACGHADTFNTQGQPVPEELGTWVDQNAPELANPKVQSAQLFPNPKLKKKSGA